MSLVEAPFWSGQIVARAIFTPATTTAASAASANTRRAQRRMSEQLERALDGPRQHRAVAALHDRPLQELRVLRHQAEPFVVGDLALAEPELVVYRLPLADDVLDGSAGLRHELADLRLGQRVDVVVDPLEIDAALGEQREQVLTRGTRGLLVN